MKRLTMFGAVLALLSLFVLPAVAGSWEAIPRVGEKVDIFFSSDVTIQADTPFHIEHGWICETGLEECVASTISSWGFEMSIDGQLQRPIPLLAVEHGYWVRAQSLYQFRKGLPVGDYAVDSCAYSPMDTFCTSTQLHVVP